MNFRLIMLAILASIMLTTVVAADNAIYTWTDENGVQHMSNIPPVDSKVEVEILKTKPIQVVEGVGMKQSRPEKKSSKEKNTTRISIVNNHVIVPVTLRYKTNTVRANLLLDTGSSNITLHRSIAKKLKVMETKKGSIRVAGGDLIDAEGVILDSVTVGPKTASNLLAGIIDYNGTGVPYQGLLGMNFLKNYPYTIDFSKKVLRWKN